MIIVYLIYLIILFAAGRGVLLYRFQLVFPYPLGYGLLLVFYSFIFDILMNTTPGKFVLSLRLSSIERGRVVWIFLREIFKANLYILLLDTLFGILLSGGRSLRMTDYIFGGEVIEAAPRQEPLPQIQPRPLYRPTPPPPPEGPSKEAPVQQATYEGRCPRCGMPYALTADGRELSGLWNGMCIWCGYPVLRHLGV